MRPPEGVVISADLSPRHRQSTDAKRPCRVTVKCGVQRAKIAASRNNQQGDNGEGDRGFRWVSGVSVKKSIIIIIVIIIVVVVIVAIVAREKGMYFYVILQLASSEPGG